MVDCQGLILSPGFIDIQLNGAFGIDFTSCPPEELEQGVAKVSEGILKYGVTSYCPTLITSEPSTYASRLPRVKRKPGGPHGATVLGTHLEGPFINREKRGAHPEGLIVKHPNGYDDVAKCYGYLDETSLVTLAPELEETPVVIEELRKRDIKVSMGHTKATIAQGETAMCYGANLITHLFNAMTAFHHRDPGIVGLLAGAARHFDATGDCNLFYGLIVDGFHTHDAALRIAHATHPNGTATPLCWLK